MDPLTMRVRELARELACNRHAISLRTAEDLVTQIARSEGVEPPSTQLVEKLVRDLRVLIVEHWEAQGAADIAS